MKKKSQRSGIGLEIGMRHPDQLLPEREVALNLAKTFSALNQPFDELFKEHGITSAQYNALRILRGHGKPVSVYQIGEQMLTRQSDLPRLVDRLVSLGFAEKNRCEKDRRVVWVKLTRKGTSLLKRMDEPLDNLHREQLKHLSREQMKQLSDLLWLARNPDASSD
ncbi:MarR family transcriptional regulator [Stieleria sp. JC731]|uniref:MarR family winged helix-turn-helix transcriptional regulator n=1 Tax=Pirellulaceae TaxID=2691357 RepID=UPI001E2C57F0|nr:MarR family transcriptional regulator [Stieleria sp. JC731]MCC9600962.1 MarR family transcriptional regulator [Stieleria sp. JC731]